MATTIDRLSVQLGMDASQFAEGARLTRKELSQVNRAMRDAEEPADKLNKEIFVLEKAIKAGHDETGIYAERLERLKRKLADTENNTEEAKAAQRQMNEEMQRAKQITRSVETANERYQREVNELNKLMLKGRISITDYRRAMDRQREALRRSEGESQRNRRAMGEHIPVVGRLTSEIDANGAAFVATGIAVAGATAGFYAAMRASRALARAISEQLTEVDKIAKASRKLGTTTDELVGLQFAAAELSGMADTQVSTAIQRMTRRIAEAANGSGEAKAAIEELGLSAHRLAQKSPAEAFKDIAEAIRNVGNESQQLRVAFKLFDSEGASLVTTLAAGRKGLERMEKRARELGLTFSDLQKNQIEAANDALFEAQAAMDGAARSATIVLAPALEDAAKHFASITTGADNSVESLQKLQNHVRIYAAAVRDSLTRGFGPDEQLNAAGQMLAEAFTQDIGNAFGGEAEQQQQTVAEQAERDRQQRENAERATEDAINAQLDAMRQQNALIGATREEAERYKLEMMGATEEQIRQLEAAQAAREHLERWQAADEDRRSKETEQVEKATEKAKELQALGRPGAAEQGSREALKAIQGIRDQAAQDRRKQLALEEKQVEQGQQMVKLTRDLNRRLGRLPQFGGVG